MKELAYINGVFCPIDEAKISIEDRGFQFGDSIYEVIAVYDGRPFLLEQHMRRLRRSLTTVHLEHALTAVDLESVIIEGLRRAGTTGDAMVYIQITRGVQPRSHVAAEGITPTVILTFKSLPRVSDELRLRGARVVTVRDIRWSNCFVKATTLLPNVMAKNDAIQRGYDDAIFVTGAGEVRELTSANIFMIKGTELIFPPRNESVLHGVTQGFILACAEAVGLTVKERSFTVDAMMRADELFMSSTTVEILGVTSVDDDPIGDGTVGDHTRRLFEEFQVRSRETTAGAPQSMAG